MSKYVFIVLSFFILGCSSHHLSPIAVSYEIGASYTVGQTITAKTGSPMINIWNNKSLLGYKADYFFQPPRLDGYDLSPVALHQEWLALYQEDDSFVINSQDFDALFGILINKEGAVRQNPLVNLTPVLILNDLSPRVIPQSDWQLPVRKLFTRVGDIPTKGSFRCELIYLGKINNYIELQYNEYVDGNKQSNFSHNIKYELTDKDRIDYKTFKLRIISATANDISFTITDDGGLPWLRK